MQRNTWWLWAILAAAILGSVAAIWPPYDVKNEQGKVVKASRLKLGLDLRGGTSFIVVVDKDELRKQIKDRTPDLAPERVEERVTAEMKGARDVALEAIRNRVDGLGIAEPQIFPQMDDRIVVQMPGIDANKRDEARRSIQSVAFLEFRLIHLNNDKWVKRLGEDDKAPRGFKPAESGRDVFFTRDPQAVPNEAMDSAFWAEVKRFAPHEGAELMLQKDEAADGSTIWRPYYVELAAQLTGKAVKNAMVDYDQMSRPKISLEFNRTGRRQFAQVTRNYAPFGDQNRENSEGRRLGIILDGTLYSAPVLKEEISSGRAEITGRFTLQEVKRLVNVLRTGALLAPMKIVQESTVDPTLGKDSIRSGVLASLVGAALVAIFMFLYYLVPGVFANVAMFLDVVLMPLGMLVVAGIFGVFTRASGGSMELPTLTLPGIAGIALTFGMAVDANVLIYERMREELKAGKHLAAAIESGYDRSFLTIFDSNITTLLAAVIMFWQGSGPIRGYAITLSAGIIVSMYTAIVVTRMLFNSLVSSGRLKTLKMMSFIKETNFDFLGKKMPFIALSVVTIVVSWGAFLYKGKANFGVDFVGGSSLTFEFTQKQPEQRIRSVLSEAGVSGEPLIQYQSSRGAVGEMAKDHLVVQVAFEDGEKTAQALPAKLGDAGFKLVQKEEIGPQIGAELKKKGLYALLWSMIGMIIYISWRFEFGFAVGAIVALLHDALVAVGVFCLLGRQLSAPMIAVVLTIIGYSVNDTIVIFDRIREDVKLLRGRKFTDLCNLAINQTLSRTIITTGTVFLTVLSLLFFGGGAINDFALMLVIGLIAGTYSTIFIATPVMLLWHQDPSGQGAAAAKPAGGRNGKGAAPAKATA